MHITATQGVFSGATGKLIMLVIEIDQGCGVFRTSAQRILKFIETSTISADLPLKDSSTCSPESQSLQILLCMCKTEG